MDIRTIRLIGISGIVNNFRVGQRWLTNLLVKMLIRQMMFGNGNDLILYNELMEWRKHEKV